MPLVQTRGAASAQGFGEFAQAAVAVNYIEDVFSTYLYTGNSSTQTITNDIDLSTKGGLVWIRCRSTDRNNSLYDTVRGANQCIFSNLSNAQFTDTNAVNSFTSTGFTLGAENRVNASADTYASWTWRKQAKFFDVVTWTGTGANRTIAHALGSVPGCIIVKRTDTASDWAVYHRSLANTQYLVLNTTAAAATGATWWNSTTPTSAVFSVGTDATVNATGGTYVAYIFAHDDGGFGDDELQNVVSCGSFTTDGSGNATVSLGYEPQWVMTKSSSAVGDWFLVDNMRGFTVAGQDDAILKPNLNTAETSSGKYGITSTGFTMVGGGATVSHIYVAIRRGPMKVPTLGTSVFSPVARTGTGAVAQITGVGFPPDLAINADRTRLTSANTQVTDRLRGTSVSVFTNRTDGDLTYTNAITAFGSDGETLGTDASQGAVNVSGNTYINWFFRRAPGFFDEVAYTGTGSALTVPHNLAAVPELMIVKRRDNTSDWLVYTVTTGNSAYLLLNGTNAVATPAGQWQSTTPTASNFYVTGTLSSTSMVAYLFATVAGVSKVGSYTGTAAAQTINCGFTGGARFVLIKRTDSTGDWYVWDTARGIVSGNDSYLLLNSTAAEVTSTDYIDTYSAGFEISSTAPAAINANGGSFIFFAVA